MSAIALDPLIAEAKQRARRRRLLALGLSAVLAAAAVGVALQTRSSSSSSISLERLAAAAREQIQATYVGDLGGGVIAAWSADGYSVWVTANDGRTWRPLQQALVDDAGLLPPASFLDRRAGWGLGGGHIMRTTNGGRTWRVGPALPGQIGTVMTGPLFVSRTAGFVEGIVGFGTLRDVLFATDDGGRTWQRRSLPAGSTVMGTVLGFVSRREGFARGVAGIDATHDGGRTWRVLFRSRPGCSPSFDGAFRDGTIVVTCGNATSNRYYVSRDDGSTWSTHTSPAGVLSVLSPRTWFIPRTPSGVLVTTNAGRSWTLVRPVNVPRPWTLYRVSLVSARDGWAIFRRPGAQRAVVLARYRRCIASGKPKAGCLFDKQDGLDPSSHLPQGVIMRTTDGGRHWTPAGPLRSKAHTRG